jgi:hypothetical protein
MLTSPPFEGGRDPRLRGSVASRASLTAEERGRMYSLLEMYFQGTSRSRFETDLAEKEAVVLLREAGTGEIQGFSTLMRISACIDRQEVVAFFSGDTIVAREFWGETVLSRLWSRTVFAEAVLIQARCPATRVYWYLICSGYRTWRFLPVFFREFYPNPKAPTPPNVQCILDTFGKQKFGDQYQEGIVRFHQATPLREGIAEVTDHRLRDPHVEFFARMNPGHADGHELTCLT